MRVRSATRDSAVRARIELDSLDLVLDGAGQATRLPPSFVARWGERVGYTDTHGPAVIGFAGWRPHGPRRWPTGSDKQAFKQSARAAGLQTPAACIDPAQIGGPFLIKHRQGSFGEGQRGPFLQHDADDGDQRLRDGEFHENFILGTAAKLWCWGPQVAALALQPPAIVTGDGHRSLRMLVEQPGTAAIDWTLTLHLARLCGLDSLDAVPAAGREVLVDHRYGDRPGRAHLGTPDWWPQVRDTPLGAALAEAAQRMAATIPAQEAPARTLFTLDAVIDADGQPWWLEMNCLPLVHPAAYAAMLPDLLA